MNASVKPGYWVVSLIRSAIALAIGLVITFDGDHSPIVGYLALGAFAVATGIIVATAGLVFEYSHRVTIVSVAGATILVGGGIVSLALHNASVRPLLFLMCAIIGVAGVLELVLGLLERDSPLRRDWIFSGALSAVLAASSLLIPSNFVQRFTGPDGVERSLTASVIVVGAFGAYAVILGVYLSIAGLSQYWVRAGATKAREGA